MYERILQYLKRHELDADSLCSDCRHTPGGHYPHCEWQEIVGWLELQLNSPTILSVSTSASTSTMDFWGVRVERAIPQFEYTDAGRLAAGETKFEPLDSVQLKEEYTNESGVRYTAGQCGTVICHTNGKVLVDMDGYDKERAENHSNVVPYRTVFPSRILALRRR